MAAPGQQPWPAVCHAPGPDAMACTGPEGHAGHHGMGSERWSPETADRIAQEEGVAPATLEVRGFAGAVVGNDGATWRGMVSQDDQGVHVDLLAAPRSTARPLGVQAVWLPYAAVARVEHADEQAAAFYGAD